MIELSGVGFAYEGDPALADVTLSIESGETVALMGANGAGKTTLLRILAGLVDPDEGDVAVDGVVGFAPEDPKDALFAETVAEEVAFFPRNRGLDVEAHAGRAMDAMAVARFADREPHSLSAGEQRRVSIASVLAGDPAVIALDEPTSGLGRHGERELCELLSGVDATVVVATHAADFAYEVADRVAVLADGRLLRIGGPRDVLGDRALLDDAAVREPGIVEWARRRGFERLPRDFDEAVEMAREDG